MLTESLTYLIKAELDPRTANMLMAAQEQANKTSESLRQTEEKSLSVTRTVVTGIRILTNLKQTVDAARRAFLEFDPMAMLYMVMNLIQTMEAIQRLRELLQGVSIASKIAQAATAAYGAVLAAVEFMTGNWALVLGALAAGAAVGVALRSMQKGGPVNETGLYLLHRGEYVVPSQTYNRFGPIYVNFAGGGGGNALGLVETELVRKARRMGV